MKTTEERIFDFCLWLIAACILLGLLTSCSPYVQTNPTATATASPAGTATAARLTPSPSTTPRATCTVNGETVYLRSGAGMNYAVIDVLHEGQALTVIARGAWLEIETPQQIKGWVYSKYCQ